ncbi:TonB-dependent receptor [bacterium]|nr:TonB-dependent receptor [bacterium]
MRGIILKTLILFLSVISCISAVSPEKGTIRGAVTDKQGNPVVKAHVMLMSTVIGGVTDNNGTFTLTGVPEGVYSLKIKHISFSEKIISPVIIRSKQIAELGTIVMNLQVLRSPGISVTATRSERGVTDISQAVNLITENAIRERNQKTSAEVLRDEPGVFVQKTSHGGGSAIIRGLSSNQILLLVDGIRMNNSTYRLGNHSYLTMIDYFTLNQIEVVRGPTSVMYGSDALGGTINAITKDVVQGESKSGIGYRVFGRWASADNERTSRVDMSYSGKRIGMLGGVSVKKFGDLRRGVKNSLPELEHSVNGPVQSPSGFDCLDWDYKLISYPSETTKLIFSSQYTKKSNLPRYDKYENDGYYLWLYNPQKRHLSYLRLEKSLNNLYVSSLQVTASMNIQDEGRKKQKKPESSITKEWVGVKTGGFSVQLRSFFNKHFLTYGSEIYHDLINAERYKQDPVTFVSQKDEQARYPDGAVYTSIGAYLQDEVNISGRLKSVTGVRLSRFYTKFSLPASSPITDIFGETISQNFHALTGSEGLIYKMSDGVFLNCNFGQAFRAPNLSDISKLGESKGNTFEIPNPELRPESMTSFDTGVKIEKKNVSAEVSVYYASVNNLIASADAVYGGSSVIERNSILFKVKSKQNTGRAYLCGVESALNYRSDIIDVFSNLTMPYGWNVTLGEPVGGIPPLFGLFGAQINMTGCSIEWFVRFAAKQDKLSSDDMDDPRIPVGGTPGWVTVNLRANYNIPHIGEIMCSIENIFDVNYREHGSGINGPGRNFIISIEIRK